MISDGVLGLFHDCESDPDNESDCEENLGKQLVEIRSFPNGTSLQAYVSEDGDFRQNFRLKKPLVIEGFLSEIGVDVVRDAVGAQTETKALVAKDNVHFFANLLCEERECTFGEVVQEGLFSGSPQKLYCRLRPIPRKLLEAVGPSVGSLFRRKDPLFHPELCACWIGSAGVITPLHFDLCHGFLATISGKKRVTLFPPEDTLYLYRQESTHPNPNSSKASWEAWRDDIGDSRKRWSKLEEASPMEVELGPGQMLYTPPGWWHTVEGATPTVAVLLPFDMAAHENLHPALFR